MLSHISGRKELGTRQTRACKLCPFFRASRSFAKPGLWTALKHCKKSVFEHLDAPTKVSKWTSKSLWKSLTQQALCGHHQLQNTSPKASRQPVVVGRNEILNHYEKNKSKPRAFNCQVDSKWIPCVPLAYLPIHLVCIPQRRHWI